MAHKHLAKSAALILGAWLSLLVGCTGPDLGEVKGTVRLKGQPLTDAVVTFSPVAKGGSTSVGTTNQAGQYELIYTNDDRGAELGEHLVRVSTFRRGDPDAAPPRPERPEVVPAEFNKDSRLTKSVASGDNLIDIDLGQ